MSVYSASVDDTDPQIVYSSGWDSITSDQFPETFHSTSLIGSFASFRFTGSAVAIRCTIPSGAGEQSIASLTIDNGLPMIIFHETASLPQRQHVFWDSGPLEMGSHLLIITNLANGVSLRLDTIDYEPEIIPPSTPLAFTTTSAVTLSQSMAEPTSALLTDTISNGFQVFTPESTPTFTMQAIIPTLTNPIISAAVPSSSESTVHVWTIDVPAMQILVGVFGGVLIICFAVYLAFSLARRRRRMEEMSFPDDMRFLSPVPPKKPSKSSCRSFPKEPELICPSPPTRSITLRSSKENSFLDNSWQDALRNPHSSSRTSPGLPAHCLGPPRRPITFPQPQQPPAARHQLQYPSMTYALRRMPVARPHPFSAAALQFGEPSAVLLAENIV